MASMLWVVSLALSVLQAQATWAGTCDVVPVQGCACHDHYGIMVTCSDLDLTSFPVIQSSELLEIDTLDLSGNRIEIIPEDAVDIGVTIRNLVMNANNGGELSSGFFNNVATSVTDRIESIEMDNSGFTEIPDFSARFDNLRRISFRDNAITFLDLVQLNRMQQLEEVFLSGNQIARLQFKASDWNYGTMSLLVFDISWVHEVGSALLYHTAQATHGQLTSLSIVNSPITDLEPYVMLSFLELESLEISGSHMNDAYINDELQEELAWKWNSYQTLLEVNFARNIMTKVPRRFLRAMTRLYTLDLSHNAIVKVREGSFRSNPNLAYINLSHNNIRVVEGAAFTRDDDMEPFREIDLSYNDLTTLAITAFPYNFWEGYSSLLIGQNPWSCDCDLPWLINMAGAEASGNPGALSPYELSHLLRCASPEQFSGFLFTELYDEYHTVC